MTFIKYAPPDQVRATLEPYVAKLTSMESSDELRKFFVDEGVKGEKQRPMCCVIAAWLKRETRYSVVVTKVTIDSVLGACSKYPYGRIARITPAMEEFINSFDRGYYPELVA